MPTVHVDANAFYDTIRRAAQAEMRKELGGRVVVHALAVLLGEAIASSPLDLQSTIGGDALNTVNEHWARNVK